MPSDFTLYLDRQPWYKPDIDPGEQFAIAVDNLLRPHEFRKRVLEWIVGRSDGIGEGYRAFSRIVQRRLAWTMLTSNFDPLLANAYRSLGPSFGPVIEIKTKNDLGKYNQNGRNQIIYLHGSLEYYNDRNTPGEIDRLDTEIVERILPITFDSPLIVIGYRGAELSIMEHFLGSGIQKSGQYKEGVFWCRMPGEQLHPNVEALKSQIGSNFHEFEIAGFDELLIGLEGKLKDTAYVVTSALAVPPKDLSSFESHCDLTSDLSDIDISVALSTFKEYSKNLKIPAIEEANLEAWMLEHGYAVLHAGKLHPTNAALLLFGKFTEQKFPFAKILLITDEKKQRKFEGNLIKIYRDLYEVLTSEDINPEIRLKGERKSDNILAYYDLAIRELLVNCVVHRDYYVNQYSTIKVTKGVSIEFSNPGGLLPEVKASMEFKNGEFKPTKELSELRNRIIADIFCGLNLMEKLGTGLREVIDLSALNGGKAIFTTLSANEQFLATLFQPRTNINSSTAVPLQKNIVYRTNLLPFINVPTRCYRITLLPNLRLKEVLKNASFPIPPFVRSGPYIWMFENPSHYERFCFEIAGEVRPFEIAFDKSQESRSILIRLLRAHWEDYLRTFSGVGLRVIWRESRAYFTTTGGERNTITYDTPRRKNISRSVVKPRIRGERVEHENEGISYHLVPADKDQWAIQIKPIYIFTKSDGSTPLPEYMQGSRSTRRYKFDRGPSVESDLTFWERFLSKQDVVIDISGRSSSKIILEPNFYTVEIPSEIAKHEGLD